MDGLRMFIVLLRRREYFRGVRGRRDGERGTREAYAPRWNLPEVGLDFSKSIASGASMCVGMSVMKGAGYRVAQLYCGQQGNLHNFGSRGLAYTSSICLCIKRFPSNEKVGWWAVTTSHPSKPQNSIQPHQPPYYFHAHKPPSPIHQTNTRPADP